MEIENRSTAAADLLRLGNDLTEFANSTLDAGPRSCPARQVLAMLMARLADLGDIALLTEAMALYRDLDTQRDRDRVQRRQLDKADAAERKRRHNLALTVPCPFCKAEPHNPCLSQGEYPQPLKSTQHHAPRYRKAEHSQHGKDA